MPTIKRLPLNALRVFEAVARTGSMAKAAEVLNVQPSAVSMQMQNLADYVGLPLLSKQGRGIELTAHGAQLLPKVVAGLAGIEHAVESLRDSARSGPLILSMLPSFLHVWFMPRLSHFELKHPSIPLQIVTGRELLNLAAGQAHAAVRLGGGKWPGLSAEKLMNEWLVPVATPKLLKQFGKLKRGKLSKGVPLVHTYIDPWTLWTDEQTGATTRVSVDDSMAVIAAATMGKGYALARWSLIQQELQEGRLCLAGEVLAYRWAYYWVTTPQRKADERLQTILEWLRLEVNTLATPT